MTGRLNKINTSKTSAEFRMACSLDIPALVCLAQAAHTESRFGYIPFSPEKVQNIITSAMKDEKRNGVIVALRGSVLIGFAYCSIGEYHIGTGVLLTTIHNINVLKTERASLMGGRAALGLFKGIETWSKARGAKEVLFHVSSGLDLASTHKLAKRMGYDFGGGNYVKAL